MKISKNILSKLNLFAAAFNATISPNEYNMRMAAECFNAEVNEAATNSNPGVETVVIETYMQTA